MSVLVCNERVGEQEKEGRRRDNENKQAPVIACYFAPPFSGFSRCQGAPALEQRWWTATAAANPRAVSIYVGIETLAHSLNEEPCTMLLHQNPDVPPFSLVVSYGQPFCCFPVCLYLWNGLIRRIVLLCHLSWASAAAALLKLETECLRHCFCLDRNGHCCCCGWSAVALCDGRHSDDWWVDPKRVKRDRIQNSLTRHYR